MFAKSRRREAAAILEHPATRSVAHRTRSHRHPPVSCRTYRPPTLDCLIRAISALRHRDTAQFRFPLRATVLGVTGSDTEEVAPRAAQTLCRAIQLAGTRRMGAAALVIQGCAGELPAD